MQKQSASHPTAHSMGQNIVNRVSNVFQALLRSSESPKRLISIEERLPIGHGKTLMLVNVAGRRFLLAIVGDSITFLVEAPPSPEGT